MLQHLVDAPGQGSQRQPLGQCHLRTLPARAVWLMRCLAWQLYRTCKISKQRLMSGILLKCCCNSIFCCLVVVAACSLSFTLAKHREKQCACEHVIFNDLIANMAESNKAKDHQQFSLSLSRLNMLNKDPYSWPHTCVFIVLVFTDLLSHLFACQSLATTWHR